MSRTFISKLLSPTPALTAAERTDLEADFHAPGLTHGWSLVAVGKPDSDAQFLCLDWALYRLYAQAADLPANRTRRADLLRQSDAHMTEGRAASGTTDYTVAEFLRKALDGDVLGLVECAETDANAVAIIWGIDAGNDHAHVGHIQVKHNGAWESKLSHYHEVISHARDDMSRMKDLNLRFAKAYKFRTTSSSSAAAASSSSSSAPAPASAAHSSSAPQE